MPIADLAVGFPAAEVEFALRKALLIAVTRDGGLRGVVIPANVHAAGALPFDIDSLEVVDLLCELDSVLSFEVGQSVVKAGGYASIDDAIQDLLPKLELEWRKHQREA